MNKQVSIPSPCHMSWKDLDPTNSAGKRHCTECAIDIIDFTQMSNEEIIDYLSKRKGEKVCVNMYFEPRKSNYSGLQKSLLNWHKRTNSRANHSRLKPLILGILGLALSITGCVGVGEAALTCQEELVPDTSTVDPSDSTYVENCY